MLLALAGTPASSQTPDKNSGISAGSQFFVAPDSVSTGSGPAVADRSLPAAAAPENAEAGVGAEAAASPPKSTSAEPPATARGNTATPATALGILPVTPSLTVVEPVVTVANPPHRFMDRTALWLEAGNVAAQTLDAVTTQRFLARRTGAEANPFARLFVTHGWRGQIAYSYGWSIGGSIASAYWLHTHGHHRLERWVPALVAGSTAACGLQNLRLMHPAMRPAAH